jgi:hypothetical protein
MIKAFLENKKHSYAIAQVAVAFQSVLTVLLVVSLLFSLTSVAAPIEIISWLLVIDVTFVVVHLVYRGTYRGPKVVLKQEQKRILVAHILSSLAALCATGYLVSNNLEVKPCGTWVVIIVWVASLVSGLLFFRKKYNE